MPRKWNIFGPQKSEFLMPETKAALRKSMLQTRESLSESEVKTKSKIILSTLQTLPEFKAANHVCIYVSTKNEVQTQEFIQNLLKSKKVSVPMGTTISQLTAWKDLKPNIYGILEPQTPIPTNDINIFIVPGAVFDISGHRIGYGKGYYDRLLSQSQSKKIGLAYDFQIVEQIHAEPHDIKMNLIITEKRIIRP